LNIKAFRLILNALRRAEIDYLSPHVDSETRASARSYLFGLKESPLPCVCKALGLNVLAARLTLIKWRAQGKIGDPLFSFLQDPSNLLKSEHGLAILRPDFKDLYEYGANSRKQEGSG
jgi:hypothetical protein